MGGARLSGPRLWGPSVATQIVAPGPTSGLRDPRSVARDCRLPVQAGRLQAPSPMRGWLVPNRWSEIGRVLECRLPVQ